MQNERSLLDGNWNFRAISQLIYFLEEESPSNETMVHGAFYDRNLAEQYQTELESKTFQRLMDDKGFQTVEEAQAYLLDRDEDYALKYSRFRILSFQEAVEAFGANRVLQYLTETFDQIEDESNEDLENTLEL
ncbi:MAG: hypothetical protein ACOH5I_10185 [Oligoflexus sp.]